MSKNKNGIIRRIRRQLQVYAYDLTTPEMVSKFYFRYLLKYPLNLKNPQTFNEKLQWLKLYEWPENPIAIQCGDKYTVRAYLEEKGLDSYLNDLIGHWEKVEDIDWDSLPNQFAMKVSNACGENIICEDKSRLDIEEAKKKLNMWIKRDFGKFNAEPHYSKMKPHIICEKFLGGDMVDYKFFCFGGKMKFMYIAQGFGHHINERITFFDENGNKAPYRRTDYPIYQEAVAPDFFEEMSILSEKLSEGLPFLRVDWFEHDGKIYFGEMTFTPCGGLMKIDPIEYDKIWGSWIDISGLIQKRKSKQNA